MNIEKLNKRNSSMDLIRIVATLCVLSVHFFLHNGFYYETVEGTEMYIMSLMRTLFSVCVPLFLVLTGYLMSHKTLSKKYYTGIRKTIIIYILAGIACIIYKSISGFQSIELDFQTFLFGTLDFTGANYSWYIEMYIGLFLIIPFLNILYNKIETKRHKQVLLLTMICLTILPSLFNIFNLDSAEWWTNPASSDDFQKLVPSWWTSLYPITYYFTGCYLREYKINLRIRHLVPMFIAAIVLFGSFNYYRSYGTNFKSGTYVYWYGFESFILTVLLFMILSRLSLKKLPNAVRFTLWKISDLTLGIYLVSFIFDSWYYPILNENITPMVNRLPYYFLMVPCVFISSLILSAVLNLLEKLITFVWKKIYSSIIYLKENADRIMIMDIVFIVLFFASMIFLLWKVYTDSEDMMKLFI